MEELLAEPLLPRFKNDSELDAGVTQSETSTQTKDTDSSIGSELLPLAQEDIESRSKESLITQHTSHPRYVRYVFGEQERHPYLSKCCCLCWTCSWWLFFGSLGYIFARWALPALSRKTAPWVMRHFCNGQCPSGGWIAMWQRVGAKGTGLAARAFWVLAFIVLFEMCTSLCTRVYFRNRQQRIKSRTPSSDSHDDTGMTTRDDSEEDDRLVAMPSTTMEIAHNVHAPSNVHSDTLMRKLYPFW